MRHLRVLLIVGLVLAVTVPASAINFRTGYQGPVTIKFTSWDMGVVYLPPAALQNGIGAVNAYEATPGNSSLYAPAFGGVYYDTNGNVVVPNAALREDGWGILTVTEIYKSGTSPINPANILWMPGDGGKELTMMFYGLVDNAIAPGGFLGSELIQSQNVRFDLYENALGSFAAAGGATQGSAGRTGFATYNGITNVAGGVLSLEGLTMPGVGQIIGSAGPDEFLSNFTPNIVGGVPQNTGSGTFAALLELNAANALLQRDYLQFNTDGMQLGADLTVNGTTTPNDGSQTQNGLPIANWTVLNEDPFRGNAIIPEPVTMAGLMLGIGCLSRYVRKRR
jgi:hypothetical protein